jgi:hypothetical protein
VLHLSPPIHIPKKHIFLLHHDRIPVRLAAQRNTCCHISVSVRMCSPSRLCTNAGQANSSLLGLGGSSRILCKRVQFLLYKLPAQYYYGFPGLFVASAHTMEIESPKTREAPHYFRLCAWIKVRFCIGFEISELTAEKAFVLWVLLELGLSTEFSIPWITYVSRSVELPSCCQRFARFLYFSILTIP